MTPEAQRIAIAEACPNLFIVGKSSFGLIQLYWLQDECQGAAVDPLSDLNASWIMEKTLTDDEEYDYNAYLSDIDDDYVWKRTADQKAKCFLKAKKLWDDTK